MEDVLKENQRLSAAVAAAGPPADKSEVEMLRAEIDHLRQRLTSSELLRHRGQEALQELKEEFETLHFDLMQNPDTAMSAQTMLAQE